MTRRLFLCVEDPRVLEHVAKSAATFYHSTKIVYNPQDANCAIVDIDRSRSSPDLSKIPDSVHVLCLYPDHMDRPELTRKERVSIQPYNFNTPASKRPVEISWNFLFRVGDGIE